MAEINIADSKGRDAVVTAASVTQKQEVRWVNENDVQVGTRKILRSTLAHDVAALEEQAGSVDAIADALLAEDPEVDTESFGMFLEGTSRVYLNGSGDVCHRIVEWEVIRTPEGEEKARRPKQAKEPNVAVEMPLKWTGKLLPKAEACRRFVFSGKMQIQHVNGLTYDFLYGMAKELEEKNSLMLVAGGAKSNEPLVFRRGGSAYRGFLEGRTEGNRYALVLHLSNLELKVPEEKQADEE